MNLLHFTYISPVYSGDINSLQHYYFHNPFITHDEDVRNGNEENFYFGSDYVLEVNPVESDVLPNNGYNELHNVPVEISDFQKEINDFQSPKNDFRYNENEFQDEGNEEFKIDSFDWKIESVETLNFQFEPRSVSSIIESRVVSSNNKLSDKTLKFTSDNQFCFAEKIPPDVSKKEMRIMKKGSNIFSYIKSHLLQPSNGGSKTKQENMSKRKEVIVDKTQKQNENLKHVDLETQIKENRTKSSEIGNMKNLEDKTTPNQSKLTNFTTADDLCAKVKSLEETLAPSNDENTIDSIVAEESDTDSTNDRESLNRKVAKLLEDDGKRYYMSDACLSHSKNKFTEIFESHFDADIYMNTLNDDEVLDSDDVVDIRLESHIPSINAKEYIINMPKLFIRTLPFSINIIRDEVPEKDNFIRQESISEVTKMDSDKIKALYFKAKHPIAFPKDTYAVSFPDSLEEKRTLVDSETQTHIDLNNYELYKRAFALTRLKPNNLEVDSKGTQTSESSSSPSETLFPNLQRNDDADDTLSSICSSYEFFDTIEKDSNIVAIQVDQCLTPDKEIRPKIPSILISSYEDTESLDEKYSSDDFGLELVTTGRSKKRRKGKRKINSNSNMCESDDSGSQGSVFVNDSGFEQSYDFSIYEENLGNDTDFDLEENNSFESEDRLELTFPSTSDSPIDFDTISDYERETEKDYLTIEPPSITVSEQYLSTLKVVSTLFASTFSLLEEKTGVRKPKGKYPFELSIDEKIRNLRNSKKSKALTGGGENKRVSFDNFVKYNFISKEGKLICYTTTDADGERCKPFAVYISEEIFV